MADFTLTLCQVADFTFTLYTVPDNIYGVFNHDTKVGRSGGVVIYISIQKLKLKFKS